MVHWSTTPPRHGWHDLNLRPDFHMTPLAEIQISLFTSLFPDVQLHVGADQASRLTGEPAWTRLTGDTTAELRVVVVEEGGWRVHHTSPDGSSEHIHCFPWCTAQTELCFSADANAAPSSLWHFYKFSYSFYGKWVDGLIVSVTKFLTL